MEVNAATATVASTTTERDPTYLPDFNQECRPVSDVGGQRGSTAMIAYGPHYAQVQSRSSFPPYGLPPNHTPPIVVYAPGENTSSSTPVFIENQQPQLDHTHAHVSQAMEETHAAPQDYTLTSFRVYLGYTSERRVFFGLHVLNAQGLLSLDHHYNPCIL